MKMMALFVCSQARSPRLRAAVVPPDPANCGDVYEPLLNILTDDMLTFELTVRRCRGDGSQVPLRHFTGDVTRSFELDVGKSSSQKNLPRHVRIFLMKPGAKFQQIFSEA